MAKRGRPTRLGNLQLEILRVLWARGPSTVAQVQDALRGRDLAYTTVATMLGKLEPRGLVTHQCAGRTFVYAAAVPEDTVRQGIAGDLLDRVFAGSLSSLVSHLLSARDVRREELDELAALIATRRKKP
jgi:BlaI family transcriptional regulator, penicillinase repressor